MWWKIWVWNHLPFFKTIAINALLLMLYYFYLSAKIFLFIVHIHVDRTTFFLLVNWTHRLLFILVKNTVQIVYLTVNKPRKSAKNGKIWWSYLFYLITFFLLQLVVYFSFFVKMYLYWKNKCFLSKLNAFTPIFHSRILL